jgi:hypothetical protein
VSAPARLRLVVFGSSIVSDWRNPDAVAWRALLLELTRAGHDAVFLEERNNRWRVGLLKEHGSQGFREFESRFPEIMHRTYDPPVGSQRGAWFAQLVGTADAIMVLPGAPSYVIDQFNAFDSDSVVRVADESLSAADADVTIEGRGLPALTAVRERRHDAEESKSADEDDASRHTDALIDAIHRARRAKRRLIPPPSQG